MSELYTTAEVSVALGVPQQGVRDVCKLRGIEPTKLIGRYHLFGSEAVARIIEGLVELRRAKVERGRLSTGRVQLFDLDGVAAKLGVDPVRVRHALFGQPATRATYLLGDKPLFGEANIGMIRVQIGKLDVSSARIAAERWAVEAQEGFEGWLDCECLLLDEPNPEWPPEAIEHWHKFRETGAKPPAGVTYAKIKQW